MANDTQITVIGNLTADPELRWTQSGHAVASFTIASTPRQFDRQANEWKDGEALFMRSTIWRDAAENVAESLEKGDRVIAQGNLVQRSYTDRDGNNRTSIELDVQEIGSALRYATAKPNKVQRNGGRGGTQQGQPQQAATYSAVQAQATGNGWGGQQQPQQPPQSGDADPWAGGGNSYDDPIPF